MPRLRVARIDSRSRRLLLATGIYAVCVGVFFLLAARDRIVAHTPFNHFALLAEAWLDGRTDLGGRPPAYAQNNDFAAFDGKWFVTFPPFPAALLLPLVWLGGGADQVRDGQVFIWLAGVGPAVLFLALEKLRRTGRSTRSEATNAVLSLLLAFGTVYFFTALQGTVWFAAHVVAVGLGAFYLLFALDAERPVLAGLMVGLGFLTRTPLLFAVPLFAFEALRAAGRAGAPAGALEPPGRLLDEALLYLRNASRRRLLLSLVAFAAPVTLCIGFAFWHNAARFGDPLDFGYKHLTVAWKARMNEWGLFHYHYLARNLGVVLTGLPWWTPKEPVPFQINLHGLALWLTTPLYLWLLWPRRFGWLQLALYLTAAAVAVPGLFYQNTGWVQFGYRFSNDYAVFLFALLAVTGVRFGKLFALCALWAVAVNTFGAATFDRAEHRRFYFQDRSQKVFYQPD